MFFLHRSLSLTLLLVLSLSLSLSPWYVMLYGVLVLNMCAQLHTVWFIRVYLCEAFILFICTHTSHTAPYKPNMEQQTRQNTKHRRCHCCRVPWPPVVSLDLRVIVCGVDLYMAHVHIGIRRQQKHLNSSSAMSGVSVQFKC